MTPKQHEILQRGNRSHLAYEAAKEVLDKRHKEVLNSLMSHFRGESLDFPRMCGLMGQLVAIDDIMSSMTLDIKKAEKVSKEIQNEL